MCLGYQSAQAQAPAWQKITFATTHDSLRFFDHEKGKVYFYSSTKRRDYRIFSIDELGKNLKTNYKGLCFEK